MASVKTRRSVAWKTLVWTAVAAIAGVVSVVLIVARSGSGDESIKCRNTTIEIHGDDNTIGDITYEGFLDCLSRSPTRQELERVTRKFVDIEPSGDGPWPFYVSVNELGLMVRTTGTMDGRQIGTAGNGATLWVECQERTDFTPPAIEDVGPVWLRVRWPNNEPDVPTTFNSSPSDRYTGYVYKAYAFPAGHNGHIPNC